MWTDFRGRELPKHRFRPLSQASKWSGGVSRSAALGTILPPPSGSWGNSGIHERLINARTVQPGRKESPYHARVSADTRQEFAKNRGRSGKQAVHLSERDFGLTQESTTGRLLRAASQRCTDSRTGAPPSRQHGDATPVQGSFRKMQPTTGSGATLFFLMGPPKIHGYIRNRVKKCPQKPQRRGDHRGIHRESDETRTSRIVRCSSGSRPRLAHASGS